MQLMVEMTARRSAVIDSQTLSLRDSLVLCIVNVIENRGYVFIVFVVGKNTTMQINSRLML